MHDIRMHISASLVVSDTPHTTTTTRYHHPDISHHHTVTCTHKKSPAVVSVTILRSSDGSGVMLAAGWLRLRNPPGLCTGGPQPPPTTQPPTASLGPQTSLAACQHWTHPPASIKSSFSLFLQLSILNLQKQRVKQMHFSL